MTKEEELEKLETDLFMLEMKDTWWTSDYREADRLRAQIRKLKEELNGNKRDD